MGITINKKFNYKDFEIFNEILEKSKVSKRTKEKLSKYKEMFNNDALNKIDILQYIVEEYLSLKECLLSRNISNNKRQIYKKRFTRLLKWIKMIFDNNLREEQVNKGFAANNFGTTENEHFTNPNYDRLNLMLFSQSNTPTKIVNGNNNKNTEKAYNKHNSYNYDASYLQSQNIRVINDIISSNSNNYKANFYKSQSTNINLTTNLIYRERLLELNNMNNDINQNKPKEERNQMEYDNEDYSDNKYSKKYENYHKVISEDLEKKANENNKIFEDFIENDMTIDNIAQGNNMIVKRYNDNNSNKDKDNNNNIDNNNNNNNNNLLNENKQITNENFLTLTKNYKSDTQMNAFLTRQKLGNNIFNSGFKDTENNNNNNNNYYNNKKNNQNNISNNKLYTPIKKTPLASVISNSIASNISIKPELNSLSLNLIHRGLAMYCDLKKEHLQMRVSKGPPLCLRWVSWLVLNNIPVKRQEKILDFFLSKDIEKELEKNIIKDIDRTFSELNSNYFNEILLKNSLYRILKAYAALDHEIGYCQGLNLITAFLLIVCNYNEKDVFYLLISLLSNNFGNKSIIRGFFTEEFPLLKIFIFYFDELFEKYNKKLRDHFNKLDLPLDTWVGKWFQTLFTICLPVEMCQRLWDCIFAQGLNFIFSFTLAMLKEFEQKLLSKNENIEILDFFNKLQNKLANDNLNLNLTNREQQNTLNNVPLNKKNSREHNQADKGLSTQAFSNYSNVTMEQSNNNKNIFSIENVIKQALKIKIPDKLFSKLKKNYFITNEITQDFLQEKHFLKINFEDIDNFVPEYLSEINNIEVVEYNNTKQVDNSLYCDSNNVKKNLNFNERFMINKQTNDVNNISIKQLPNIQDQNDNLNCNIYNNNPNEDSDDGMQGIYQKISLRTLTSTNNHGYSRNNSKINIGEAIKSLNTDNLNSFRNSQTNDFKNFNDTQKNLRELLSKHNKNDSGFKQNNLEYRENKVKEMFSESNYNNEPDNDHSYRNSLNLKEKIVEQTKQNNLSNINMTRDIEILNDLNFNKNIIINKTNNHNIPDLLISLDNIKSSPRFKSTSGSSKKVSTIADKQLPKNLFIDNEAINTELKLQTDVMHNSEQEDEYIESGNFKINNYKYNINLSSINMPNHTTTTQEITNFNVDDLDKNQVNSEAYVNYNTLNSNKCQNINYFETTQNSNSFKTEGCCYKPSQTLPQNHFSDNDFKFRKNFPEFFASEKFYTNNLLPYKNQSSNEIKYKKPNFIHITNSSTAHISSANDNLNILNTNNSYAITIPNINESRQLQDLGNYKNLDHSETNIVQNNNFYSSEILKDPTNMGQAAIKSPNIIHLKTSLAYNISENNIKNMNVNNDSLHGNKNVGNNNKSYKINSINNPEYRNSHYNKNNSKFIIEDINKNKSFKNPTNDNLMSHIHIPYRNPINAEEINEYRKRQEICPFEINKDNQKFNHIKETEPINIKISIALTDNFLQESNANNLNNNTIQKIGFSEINSNRNSNYKKEKFLINTSNIKNSTVFNFNLNSEKSNSIYEKSPSLDKLTRDKRNQTRDNILINNFIIDEENLIKYPDNKPFIDLTNVNEVNIIQTRIRNHSINNLINKKYFDMNTSSKYEKNEIKDAIFKRRKNNPVYVWKK